MLALTEKTPPTYTFSESLVFVESNIEMKILENENAQYTLREKVQSCLLLQVSNQSSSINIGNITSHFALKKGVCEVA